MPLELVRQDITKMKVNAIVNAANTQLAMGGGVCGAIFRAAGVSRMAAACDRFAPIHTGEAVITPGFNLPSRYVIHTAGPIWRDGKHDEERLLRSCYRNSMELAARQGCASIAFPLISSGIYGYPKAEALHVALDEIRRFLGDAADSGHDLDVYLCVFDKTAFEISSSIDKRLRAYIDDYYVAEHEDTLGSRTYELLALQRFSDNKPKADRAVPSGVLDMPDFLGDMGAAIHDFVRENGYSVVREIGGHGVGIQFHEEPWVGYNSKRGQEMLMVPGMIFTIEPMVNMGKVDIYVDDANDWEVYTEDGLPSAQWEIMVLVTEDGHEVLCW